MVMMGRTDYENKLQTAIRHARREPDVPTARLAALYEVNVRTLGRRLAGTTTDYATAARDKQLFDVGEEKAIAEHAGVMADAGFPLTHEPLRGITKHIVNERQMPQRGYKSGIGPSTTRSSMSNPPNPQVTNPQIHLEALASSPVVPLIHVVGIHWVDRFLKRNAGFKKVYIRYQERARAAASNDIELQQDFLRKFANLIRRKKITPSNIWNCDEKGITM